VFNAKYFEVQKKEKERERERKIGNKKHKGSKWRERMGEKRIEVKTQRGV
jgi:hypothetical protein